MSASSILLLGPLPQVEHSRLDDETKQVLQGFQSSKEQFRLARVISVSHVKVQYLGEFPKKRQESNTVMGSTAQERDGGELRSRRPSFRVHPLTYA